MHSKHKEYLRERIEKLSSDKITAQNVSLLAQIKLGNPMMTHDDLKKEIPTAV